MEHGRRIGTDIPHSAGEILARASNWDRRRLYRGRISGMDNEERAGDASPNLVSPGRRVYWHLKRKGIGAAFRSSVLKLPLPPARRWYRERSD